MINRQEAPATANELDRHLEWMTQANTLDRKRRRLIAKAQRMHPALAREVFAAAEATHAERDALDARYGR